MIDLFSIKLNGEYDEVGAIPTIEKGIFLCDTDSEIYKRGFTYQIGDPTVHRIETVTDYKIINAICPTIQSVCEWLNNWFKLKANCKCCGDTCTQNIKTGDLVLCKSDRYTTFIGYATVIDDIITIDNPLFNPDVKYTYYIMALPPDVERAISQMIYYDTFTRGTVDGLKSENIGNYSYTLEDVTVGSLAYPKVLISGLDMNYRKLRFVQ